MESISSGVSMATSRISSKTEMVKPKRANTLILCYDYSYNAKVQALIHTPTNCNPVSSPSLVSVSVSVYNQLTTLRKVAASVSFNPQGNYNDLSLLQDDEKEESNVPAPLPPKQGRFEVVIDTDDIRRLNLYPFQCSTAVTSSSSSSFSDTVEVEEFLERTIGFTINYARDDPYDQRELCEFPDVRLWFVMLDATYPWLPVLLDWRAGELARYAAMLVPHQISARMGVIFNPEALELFIMNKVFVVYSWLKQQGVPQPKARLKTSDMARMIGFGIEDELFDLVDQQHVSSSN